MNAIAVLDTYLSPKLLLNHIQQIEKRQGRVRVRHAPFWQSRTLDLDILLFGKRIIHTPTLTIPHYDMFSREFVIYPLAELDNDLIFPNGRTIRDVISTVPKNGLKFWKNENFRNICVL